MTRMLITGAAGQIGTELAASLAARYGPEAVLATDIRKPAGWAGATRAAKLDCLDAEAVVRTVIDFGATSIFHLAAVLSAAGEADPLRSFRTNVDGLTNVLEAARAVGCKVFVPSSIAAFGPGTETGELDADAVKRRGGQGGRATPQRVVQRPTTIYGITKVTGELLCDYYNRRFGLDTRGLRFPGLISYAAPPGGGTTDYAVEIFHAAVAGLPYTCFLKPNTRLDMMYMPDAIRAVVELMEAPGEALRDRNAFNVTAMQFTPAELAAAIQLHYPSFEVRYAPDPLRQAIADSWPSRLDDSEARSQWGWRHEYDLSEMVTAMVRGLEATDVRASSPKLAVGAPPATPVTENRR